MTDEQYKKTIDTIEYMLRNHPEQEYTIIYLLRSVNNHIQEVIRDYIKENQDG